MSNSSIILDQILQQKKQEIQFGDSDSKYFEVFSSEQALKDYELSYEEILAGIVGDGGDGGIDSIYILVNGELVAEDSDFAHLKQDIIIEIIINQTKTTPSFEESTIDKLKTSCEELFDLSKEITLLKSVYNKELLKIFSTFRKTYLQLASKFPKLSIIFNYITKGESVHPNVSRKTAQLESVLRSRFPSILYLFNFIGSNELLEICRKEPSKTFTLDITETPISCTGDNAFVCLSTLKSYHQFITDDKGKLIKSIFEANVRDYQGSTVVNEQIQQTCQYPGDEEFWWLNNGITILATKAVQSSKQLIIENPEIVNGLQTSSEIFNYFQLKKPSEEKRNLLIRVIVPRSEESRDKVIRATNSQTNIPPYSLRSTDKIQRDIEEYLKPFGWYYDRRKNYYKNAGKPFDKIISISLLAQTVMSILLLKPNTARARPSSLIKEDETYLLLFNQKYPIDIYKKTVELERLVEGYLRSKDISIEDKNNLKYYLLMLCSLESIGKRKIKAEDLLKIDVALFTKEKLDELLAKVKNVYVRKGNSDQAAKGGEILAELLK